MENPANPNVKKGRESVSFFFFVLSGMVLIFLDQWVKHLAFADQLGGLLGFLQLQQKLFFNSAFAFSLPVPIVPMYVFYIVVLFLIGRYLYINFWSLSWSQRWPWLMIIAGALSNLGERALFGRVRDFILLFNGIFNLADLYILFGVVWLLWSYRKNYRDV